MTMNYQNQICSEIDRLKIQYENNVILLKGENSKLKEQIQRKRHQFQIRELEFKQRSNELGGECEALREEMKHVQHVRKMEHNQQRNQYENKIQRIHLEQRRQKELFFIEHQSQIKRLEDEITRLKKVIMEFQEKMAAV